MSYYSGGYAVGLAASCPASSAAISIKDRTTEFRSYVAHHRAVNAAAAPSSSPGAAKKQHTKEEFARKAAFIGKDITDTTVKLARLAELAKKKSLFDDRPVEISELTYVIKHDLAAINRQLAELQAQSKSNNANRKGKDRLEEHKGNVVTLLQSNLASATTAFQDVLEMRTQNMKASRDRSEQFAYPGSASVGTPQGETSNSPLYNPTGNQTAAAARSLPPTSVNDVYDPKAKGKVTKFGGYTALPSEGYGTDSGGGDDFLTLDMGGGRSDQFMQMQLQENGENQYMQQRGTAIESIESTISELGQIFSQLAYMVAEQRETVQRIDDNILDVVDNVSGAQRELLKYYNSVASNRWLMLKVFGVLIVFFLLFILVS